MYVCMYVCMYVGGIKFSPFTFVSRDREHAQFLRTGSAASPPGYACLGAATLSIKLNCVPAPCSKCVCVRVFIFRS